MEYYTSVPTSSLHSLYTDFIPSIAGLSVSQPLSFATTNQSSLFPLYDPDWSHWGALIQFYVTANQKGSFIFEAAALGTAVFFLDNSETPFFSVQQNATATRHSVSLTKGVHFLRVFFTSSISSRSLLSIGFGEEGGKIEPISGANSFIGAQPPSFLQYVAPVGVTHFPLVIPAPTLRRGYSDYYAIAPLPPKWLHFDTHSGQLEGTAETPLAMNFTVIATNALGATSTSFWILVDTELPRGMSVSMYAYQGSRDICSLRTIDRAFLSEVVTQTDVSLAHNDTQRWKPWKGFPAKAFQGVFVVQWRGNLNVTMEGTWMFVVALRDGFHWQIDGKEIIAGEMKCSTEVRSVEIHYGFTAGIHSIFIEWFNNDQDSLFSIQVKRPGERRWREFQDDLGWMPETPVSYSSQKTVYSAHQSIEPNFPLLFGVTSPAVFSAESLPRGLEMDEAGVIRGTPTTAGEGIYPIVAETPSGRFTSEIAITVEEVSPPAGIRFFTASGEEVSEVTWSIFEEISPISVNTSSPFTWLDFSSLPAGIRFNSSSRQLVGRPLSVFSERITVTAGNAGGLVDVYLTISVPGCAFGHWFVVHSHSLWGDFYLVADGEVVAQKTHAESREFAFVFCVPIREYSFAAHFLAAKSDVVVVRDDGSEYLRGIVDSSGWFNSTLPLCVSSAPVFSFDAEHVPGFVDHVLNVTFSVRGIHSPLAFHPSLPEEVSMPFEGLLQGRFATRGIVRFTVTTFNDAGEASQPIAFFIETCPENWLFLRGEKRRGTTETHLRLRNASTNKTETSLLLGSVGVREFLLCLQPMPYILSLWSDDEQGGVLRLRDEEGFLLAAMPLREDAPTETAIRLLQPVREGSVWKRWGRRWRVGGKWNTVAMKDRRWSSVKLPVVEFQAKQMTEYLRWSFSLEEEDSLPFFSLQLRTTGGMVVYVNGHFILRVNLPETSTAKTPAWEAEDWRQWHTVGVSSSYLQKGANVLAVELHRSLSSNTAEFDARSRLLTGDAFVVSSDGFASDNQSVVYEPPSHAFDDDDATCWKCKEIPAVLRYSFAEGVWMQANRAILRADETHRYHPISFAFFGVVNETVEENGRFVTKERRDLLRRFYDASLFQKPFETVSVKLPTSRGYAAYEMEVFGTNMGSGPAVLNSLQFVASSLPWCAKTRKLPSIESGETVLSRCDWRHVGAVEHICEGERWRGIWREDRSSCVRKWPQATEAFIDASLRVSNCSLRLFAHEVAEQVKKTLTSVLMVPAEEVALRVPRECGGDVPATCVFVRLLPNPLAAKFVMMQFRAFAGNATEVFYASVKTQWRDLRLEVSEMTLRERPDSIVVAMVAVVCFLSLIIVCLLVIIGKLMKGHRSLNRKKLIRPRGQERLLSEVHLGVCW